jgi:hypothetical protein
MKIEDQQCPKCQHRIGMPLDKQGYPTALKGQTLCFCVRCLAVIWLKPKQPPELAENRDLFGIILCRPQEMLRMIEATLILNKNLAAIDAENN